MRLILAALRGVAWLSGADPCEPVHQGSLAEEKAAPTSDDLEMERQLEGEVDLPTAGGGPRCDPVGDDEDEMSVCDAFDEVEGSNTFGSAARGEALDDEAPAAMAAGGEASSSAPGGETVLGRRVRGEAFDDEAPTEMAEGGEASSSAPKAKKQRGRKRGGGMPKWERIKSEKRGTERERGTSQCVTVCRGGVERASVSWRVDVEPTARSAKPLRCLRTNHPRCFDTIIRYINLAAA